MSINDRRLLGDFDMDGQRFKSLLIIRVCTLFNLILLPCCQIWQIYYRLDSHNFQHKGTDSSHKLCSVYIYGEK